MMNMVTICDLFGSWAKARPEEYQNLIVRVAGYSDYFVDLGEALQDEIIERTEQKGF